MWRYFAKNVQYIGDYLKTLKFLGFLVKIFKKMRKKLDIRKLFW